MVAGKAFQFLCRLAPTPGLSRKSPAEFRCQVEAFPGHDLSNRLLLVSCAQSRLDSPRLFRKHAIRKDFYYPTAQFLIFGGSGQELLAAALVKGDGVQLGLGHA